MKLSAYLKAKKLSAASFARKIGVSPVTVGRYLNKGLHPRAEHMASIRVATRGKVQANDFYSGSAK